MIRGPILANRDPQRYVAIRLRTQRDALGEKVPSLLAEVFEWLARHNLASAGPPIIRYLIVDYNTLEVEVDVGAPVESAVPHDARFRSGEIPAGRYAILIHCGPYENLVETTAELLGWGQENKIEWRVDEESKVTKWSGRFESYEIGPFDNPDPRHWRTSVAILLAG